MISFRTLLVVAAISICSIANADQDTFKVRPFTGKEVAAILATSCSDSGWKEFVSWGQTHHYFEDRSSTPMKIKFGATSIGFNDIASITVNEKKAFVAKVNNTSYSATDACDLFMKMVKREKTVENWNPFFSTAYASTLISESEFWDYAGQAAGSGIILLGLLPPWAPVTATAGFLIGGGLIATNEASLQAKNAFARVLDSKMSLDCGDKTVVMSYNGERIVVSKGDPDKVNIIDSKVEKVEINDFFSVLAKKSRQFAIDLAKNCKNNADAKTIMASFQNQRDRKVARFADLAINVPITNQSGAGATR